MEKRISFNKYFAEHLRDVIKNRDYDKNCHECKKITSRLNKFLKKEKTKKK